MSGLKALHLEARPRIPAYKRYLMGWNHVNNVWYTPPIPGYVCQCCQGRAGLSCTVCGGTGLIGEAQIKAEYAVLKAKHKTKLKRWLEQRSMLSASMKRLSKAQKKLIDRLVDDHMAGKPRLPRAIDSY